MPKVIPLMPITNGIVESRSEANSLDKALQTLISTWQRGRKVLVIIGAGASAKAEIPIMTSVYHHLAQKAEQAAEVLRKKILNSEQPNHGSESASAQLLEIIRLLNALKEGHAPRSYAAMALGTMQRAYLKSTASPYDALQTLWHQFSSEFVSGQILNAPRSNDCVVLAEDQRSRCKSILQKSARDLLPLAFLTKPDVKRVTTGPLIDRTPTDMHYCLSQWAKNDLAYVVSVNFDGLTKKAINALLKQTATSGAALVLSTRETIKHFFLGDDLHATQRHQFVPVIKVWGDVFHAICNNPRCPASSHPVPIFALDQGGNSASSNGSNPLTCPTCGQACQLQIYFTGYDDKERTTEELMDELLKYIAPQVGCVLTIGFSGLWDSSLVDFVASVATDLDTENLIAGVDQYSCLCIDPAVHPSLLNDLSMRKIRAAHLRMEADDFASFFWRDAIDIPFVTNSPPAQPAEILRDELWQHWIERRYKVALPVSYSSIGQNYLLKLRQLRQLGIKTKISLILLGTETQSEIDTQEEHHNRLWHSRGAGHLAIAWFSELIHTIPNSTKPSGSQTEFLRDVCYLAALHHDIGHLPFTHLAEEIFAELHWNLSDWTDTYKHDEPVLMSPFSDFEKTVEETLQKAATQHSLDWTSFRHAVEAAIRGRSGFQWIDAMVNSPLDVDKLDYVFRDCIYLKQGLHSSGHDPQLWVERLFANSRILPSGIIALEGVAGDQAREFLEERMWLYRHQYHQTGFRAIERLARAVVVQWLLQFTTKSIAERQCNSTATTLNDTSTIKGRVARDLLWKNMGDQGETKLLLKMASDLVELKPDGFQKSEMFTIWAKRCLAIFQNVFEDTLGGKKGDLLKHLRQNGVSCSEPVYVHQGHLRKVREIVRKLETQMPFRALLDVASLPKTLSYPSRRNYNFHGHHISGECFAVAHYDPDRWGAPTNRWVPLSESAFAKRDRDRWLKIMAVSPFSDDPYVWQATDRFKKSCRDSSIDFKDYDPSTTANPHNP